MSVPVLFFLRFCSGLIVSNRHLCASSPCRTGERLVGGVHLPSRPRAHHGEQQLLRHGKTLQPQCEQFTVRSRFRTDEARRCAVSFRLAAVRRDAFKTQ